MNTVKQLYMFIRKFLIWKKDVEEISFILPLFWREGGGGAQSLVNEIVSLTSDRTTHWHELRNDFIQAFCTADSALYVWLFNFWIVEYFVVDFCH